MDLVEFLLLSSYPLGIHFPVNGNVSPSRGTPGKAATPKAKRKAQKRFFPEPEEKAQPCGYLDFGLLASRIVRQ